MVGLSAHSRSVLPRVIGIRSATLEISKSRPISVAKGGGAIPPDASFAHFGLDHDKTHKSTDSKTEPSLTLASMSKLVVLREAVSWKIVTNIQTPEEKVVRKAR
jgi:hypothetical protein